MRILVVGGGGREHALAWKLAQEAKVIAAPGNPGIAQVAMCYPISASDRSAIVELAIKESVDLVVIGPEEPLIAGLADALRGAGISVFGPGMAGAMLEGSKAFSKQLMREAGVPTADFKVFTEPEEAHSYIDSKPGRLVVKASGAALGKGVIVTESREEAHDAVNDILIENAFGEAGRTIVIEDRLSGPEFSLLTLCSDGDFWSLPVAQDYKRALDGDRGPNTGGMGTFTPVPWISADLIRQTEQTVVKPILDSLRNREIGYRGVLFSGLMLHEQTPYCLEFNVRFGDPETQSVMRRLGRGFVAVLKACADGNTIPAVEVLDNAAVSVVVASGGYPNQYEKGKAIQIGVMPEGVEVFHAGTAMKGGQLVTAGGRVLAVSAEAKTLGEAKTLAYKAAQQITFEGAYYRQDIAAM